MSGQYRWTIVTTVPRVCACKSYVRCGRGRGERRARTQDPVINEAVAIAIWRTSRRRLELRRGMNKSKREEMNREKERGERERERRRYDTQPRILMRHPSCHCL